MTIAIEDVEKIAHLARLAIHDQDKAKYATELSNILNLVEQMNQVDTTDLKPMAHPKDVCQRLRTDKVTEAIDRELLQSTAPNVADGLYLVPQVIE
jgi:aspartyl-tRNA(Asn)/glutamyl-tRNA(Gln) amidotransferase subunit C